MSAIKKCVLVGLFFGMTLLPAHGQSVTTADQIRSRVTPTLALFQKMGDNWSAPCASCHHQGVVMLALAEARTHGLPLNEKSAHDHAAKTLAPMLSSVEGVAQTPLDAFGFGYTLMAVQSLGAKPNLVTSVAARRFLNAQQADGRWIANDGVG